MNNFLNIFSQQNRNGFSFDVLGKKYFVTYPPKVFSALSYESRQVLLENFVYCRTKPLCLITKKNLFYQNQKPILKNFVDYGILKDLPRVAFFEKSPLKKFSDSFKTKKNSEYFVKKEKKIQNMDCWESDDKRAILALSFGKDSLLSYGIAKELGLKLDLVYVADKNSLSDREEVFKKRIIKDFVKNEKVKINYLFDSADSIFLENIFEKKIEEFENTNGMLAFSLELIPFSKYFKAKYLIFGNEANFSDYFEKDGKKAYPSFDQSVFYSEKENQYLDKMTKGSVSAVSLVEPIYNIVEMSILVNRYQNLLSYMMSCSPKKNDPEKWCYHCPMCAKAFLYLVAVGGKPCQIGFNKDFFQIKFKNLYPLFNVGVNRAYEKPLAVRDEQLLAFLLTYRRGIKGELINLFAKKYLKEAEKREVGLRKKFLSINKIVTIPAEIKNNVINIYKKEIKKII